MTRTAKIIFYTGFVFLMGVLFLFYRFPSETARHLIGQQLVQVHPDLSLKVRSVTPSIPPGIKLEPLDLYYAGLPLFNADHMQVNPALLTIFSAQKIFNFEGAIGLGKIRGNLELTRGPERLHSKLVLNLIAVPLEILDVTQQWPAYRPYGDLNAYIDYDNRKGADGTAKISLDIVPMRIVINPPLLGLEQVEFSQLKAELTITPRMMQIVRCEADGPQFEGKLSGSIIFREPMENSRLTLSCTLRPQPAFVAAHSNDMIGGLLTSGNALKRGLVFRISGTLASPQYVIR